MLKESFIAATCNPEKATNLTTTGVHLHAFRPLPSLDHTFKKSTINANCLAFSHSHIFAAQADKAVVSVFNKQRQNLEANLPFPERITSLALAGAESGGGILILGTIEGRIILWELLSGRQVSTSRNHLKEISCLDVDLASHFILSGGGDSNIYVWSLPKLLTFSSDTYDSSEDAPLSPHLSLSRHRNAIVSCLFGHSTHKSNIAVSISQDQTCIVWDHISGVPMHTFVLTAAPLCLALDPIDRAAYVGHENGSVSIVDFYKHLPHAQPLFGQESESTAKEIPGKDSWPMPSDSASPVLSLAISYEGTMLLSGHRDGKIHTWDVPRAKHMQQLADFAAPVTNLRFQRPIGFVSSEPTPLRLQSVVKPKYESLQKADTGGVMVPENYSLQAEFTSNLDQADEEIDWFEQAVKSPTFPEWMTEAAMAELQSADINGTGSSQVDAANSRDVTALSNQLAAAKEEIKRWEKQDQQRRKDENIKAQRKKKRRLRQVAFEEAQRKKAMGHIQSEDVTMNENDDEAESSDTNELTDSN